MRQAKACPNCHSERRPRSYGATTVSAKHVLSLSKGNLGRGGLPLSQARDARPAGEAGGGRGPRGAPEAQKHKGISMFILPMNTPGITVRPLVNMASMRGFNEVFFEDVRIPANCIVGQEKNGWDQLAAARGFGRSSVAGG